MSLIVLMVFRTLQQIAMRVTFGILASCLLYVAPGVVSFESVIVGTTDWSVKDIEATFPCLDNEFQCKIAKNCIPRYLVMNGLTGQNNCGTNDTSDEENPLRRCHAEEFRCRFNGQCIPREYVNRLIGQCQDESDASGVAGLPCRKSTEFRCPQGNCIPRRAVRSMMHECTRSGFDEESGFNWTCNEMEFRCPDTGRCIPREKVRNHINDCTSGFDEAISSVLSNCGLNTGEFRCPGSMKQCIPRYKVGDGKPDCLENSLDEEIGILSSCTVKEFPCKAKDTSNRSVTLRCIPRSWVNDGVVHCSDGSDESVVKFTCRSYEHSCDNGTRCLSLDKVCDAVVDCRDCSDETSSGCTAEITSKYFVCTENLGLGEAITESGVLSSHCILRSYFCDDNIDCKDGSDERKTGPGMKCRKSRPDGAGSSTCVLPESLLNDDFVDCDDGSDESKLTEIGDEKVTCLGDSTTIFQKQHCDDIFDCPNLADECLCAERKRGNLAVRDVCNNICYTTQHIRNPDTQNPCKFCAPGLLFCSQGHISNTMMGELGQCVSLERICDGVADCHDGRDEWYCSGEEKNETGLKNQKYTTMECPHDYFTKRYSSELVSTAKVCNGAPECIGFVDECDAGKSCRPPSYCAMPQKIWCHGNTIPIIPSHICDGIPQCDDQIDEAFCDDTRFTCDVISSSAVSKTNVVSMNVQKFVSIPKSQVCDSIAHCKGGADEVECPDHFYCRNGEKPFYVQRSHMQDGIQDCTDGSDECPDDDAFKNDPLSSKSELIASGIIRAWLYIIAIPAIVGNFVVIVAKSLKMAEIIKVHIEPSGFGRYFISAIDYIIPKSLANAVRRQSALANCMDILVLNLALADFLTGFYLVTLVLKSNEYSGNYCSNDIMWRTSQVCENIGTIALLSAQTSVLIMVSLTSYRLYAVLKPAKAAKMRTKRVVFCSLCCWITSITIACLPRVRLLRDTFVSHIWFHHEDVASRFLHLPYRGIRKTALTKLLEKACVLSTVRHDDTDIQVCGNVERDWEALVDALNAFSPTATTQKEFGYFAANGVCLPSLLSAGFDEEQQTYTYDESRYFSLFILTLNFIACVYIAAAYATISLRTTIRHAKLSGQRSTEVDCSSISPMHKRRSFARQVNSKICSTTRARMDNMNKKIARLVLINCLCWIPVCVIGYIAQFGVIIPGWVYSLAAVVLLPINSAADPFIYSETIHTNLGALFCALNRVGRKIIRGCVEKDGKVKLELQNRAARYIGDENHRLHPLLLEDSGVERKGTQLEDKAEKLKNDQTMRPSNVDILEVQPGNCSSHSSEPEIPVKFVDRISKFLVLSRSISGSREISSVCKQEEISQGRPLERRIGSRKDWKHCSNGSDTKRKETCQYGIGKRQQCYKEN